MNRHIFVVLAVAALALATLTVADEPKVVQSEEPIRLKKKNKPLPEAAKPDDGERLAPEEKKKDTANEPAAKPDNPPIGPELPGGEDEDPKEILNRISKNMRLSEDRLANQETGDGTSQIQRDIVKDLNALIDQQQQQQQQSSSSSSSSSSQQRNQQNRQQASSRNSQQNQPQNGSRNQPQNQPNQGSQPQNQPNQGTQPQQANNAGNLPGGGTNDKDTKDPNKLTEVYKDVWGHLPETKRAEMEAYAREKFMAKYNDLIKQYYSTLSEKSRRKEN